MPSVPLAEVGVTIKISISVYFLNLDCIQYVKDLNFLVFLSQSYLKTSFNAHFKLFFSSIKKKSFLIELSLNRSPLVATVICITFGDGSLPQKCLHIGQLQAHESESQPEHWSHEPGNTYSPHHIHSRALFCEQVEF